MSIAFAGRERALVFCQCLLLALILGACERSEDRSAEDRLEGRDMYLKLFSVGEKNNWNESCPELELAAILQGDIPELPEDDIWGAITFIISMAESALDRPD